MTLTTKWNRIVLFIIFAMLFIFNQSEVYATEYCPATMTADECTKYQFEQSKDLFVVGTPYTYEELDIFEKGLLFGDKDSAELNYWYIQFASESFHVKAGAYGGWFGLGNTFGENLAIAIASILEVLFNSISFLIYYLFFIIYSFINSEILEHIINGINNFILNDLFNVDGKFGLAYQLVIIITIISVAFTFQKMLKNYQGAIRLFSSVFLTFITGLTLFVTMQYSFTLNEAIDNAVSPMINLINKEIVLSLSSEFTDDAENEANKLTDEQRALYIQKSIVFENIALNQFKLTNFNDLDSGDERVEKLLRNQDNYADFEASEYGNTSIIATKNGWNMVPHHILMSIIRVAYTISSVIFNLPLLMFCFVFKVISLLRPSGSLFMIVSSIKDNGISVKIIKNYLLNSFKWITISKLSLTGILFIQMVLSYVMLALMNVSPTMGIFVTSLIMLVIGTVLIANYKKVLGMLNDFRIAATSLLKDSFDDKKSIKDAINDNMVDQFKSAGKSIANGITSTPANVKGKFSKDKDDQGVDTPINEESGATDEDLESMYDDESKPIENKSQNTNYNDDTSSEVITEDDQSVNNDSNSNTNIDDTFDNLEKPEENSDIDDNIADVDIQNMTIEESSVQDINDKESVAVNDYDLDDFYEEGDINNED